MAIDIKGLREIGGKVAFPINWLHKQEYCEYGIKLQYVDKIDVPPTLEIKEGIEEHERLESEFMDLAVPATLEEMFEESKRAPVQTRELYVASEVHGIFGSIDEVLLRPDSFLIIDDKPGEKRYYSDIH